MVNILFLCTILVLKYFYVLKNKESRKCPINSFKRHHFHTVLNITLSERNIFFQAEDGIRDSVASRGLGDVYKRQFKFEIFLKGVLKTSDYCICPFGGGKPSDGQQLCYYKGCKDIKRLKYHMKAPLSLIHI